VRILYFAAHQVWPLTSGNRLRDYHLARQLAARASVTFVEMCHPGEQPSRPPSDCGFNEIITLNKEASYTPIKILRGIAGPTPLTAVNYFEPRLASQLVGILARNKFDAVQIEGVLLCKYLPALQAASNRPAFLLDWHNIDSEVMRQYSENAPSWPKRLVAKRTAKLLEKAEEDLLLLKRIGAHTVASVREREKVLAQCPSAKVHVIANGVDAGHFFPTEMAVGQQSATRSGFRTSLLFVGSMDYSPNIDAVTWFSRTAWPEIAKNHPDMQFTIVGRDPAPEVRALASDRIHVTGTVDDVRPFYASAVAVVVPIRSGSGTRLKILESMAAGVPVVSTRLGAEGIDVEHDVHILLADNSPDIAAAVHMVASSAETRVRLSQAARALVRRVYDWSLIGEQLYEIHADLAESRTLSSRRKRS
jgi:sugar transferase (PEP-CTERM/EpsH1 system associated)